jgi:hypothetical protein
MKEVNTKYYQELLDKGRFDLSDRNFYQKILSAIKKQGNKATERQYNIVIQIKNGKPLYSTKNEHIYKQNFKMEKSQLRQMIKESIQEYIREIDDAGNKAAMEAKISKTQEAIDLRKKKINMEGLDEAFHDMMDKSKIKELTSEIKMLEKSLSKYGKMLEKMNNKSSKSDVKPTEEVNDEVIDETEVNLDNPDPGAGPQLEEVDIDQIYETLMLQKRAGILSETDYTIKLEEAKKKEEDKKSKKSKLAKKDQKKKH